MSKLDSNKAEIANSVERFTALFQGWDKAHQRATPSPFYKGAKKECAYTICLGRATPEVMTNHLKGIEGAGVGIFPLLDGDRVWFGCLDVDSYDLVHSEFAKTYSNSNFVVCASKSGGAHLFVFFSKPQPAAAVAAWLRLQAQSLQLQGRVEIFPKQVKRLDVSDPGNAINIPYYGILSPNPESCSRIAYDNVGRPLSLSEFVKFAESRALSQLKESSPKPQTNSGLFKDGPPCLQAIESMGGFAEGTRAEGLYQMGVYFKKKNPLLGMWEDDHYQASQNLTHPRVGFSEVRACQDSLNKDKNYQYKCKVEPFASSCDKATCVKRMYGVGASVDAIDIDSIEKCIIKDSELDPVEWRITVNGSRILRLTTQMLYRVDLVNQAAMEQCSVVALPSISQAKWLELLGSRLPTAEEKILPVEMGTEYRIRQRIVTFCLDRSPATKASDILQKRPLRQNGMVLFIPAALSEYVRQNVALPRGVENLDRLLFSVLTRMGGERHYFKTEGRNIETWRISVRLLRLAQGRDEVEDVTKEEEENEEF